MGEAAPIVQLVGGISAFALVAWLVKHTFSKTIPRLAEDFKAMLAVQQELAKAERVAFVEELRLQRREFLEELRRINEGNRAERHECIDKLEALREKFEELTDTVRRRLADG